MTGNCLSGLYVCVISPKMTPCAKRKIMLLVLVKAGTYSRIPHNPRPIWLFFIIHHEPVIEVLKRIRLFAIAETMLIYVLPHFKVFLIRGLRTQALPAAQFVPLLNLCILCQISIDICYAFP